MRLLLAEDERALSKALTAILERNNYSVDPVYDGQAALEYLRMLLPLVVGLFTTSPLKYMVDEPPPHKPDSVSYTISWVSGLSAPLWMMCMKFPNGYMTGRKFRSSQRRIISPIPSPTDTAACI